MKNTILLLFLLCVVSSFFLINNPKLIADDSCPDSGQGSSTLAGNVLGLEDFHIKCSGAIPTIVASSDEVDPGGSITLYVNSGELANPPYTWTAGNGYTFDPVQTESDLENTTMTSSSGTCGTDYDIWTTVTVTDACGEIDMIVIRNTAGTWGNQVVDCQGYFQNDYPAEEIIIGDRKYRSRGNSFDPFEYSYESWVDDPPEGVIIIYSGCSNGCDSVLVDSIYSNFYPGVYCSYLKLNNYVYIGKLRWGDLAVWSGRLLQYEWVCP